MLIVFHGKCLRNMFGCIRGSLGRMIWMQLKYFAAPSDPWKEGEIYRECFA